MRNSVLTIHRWTGLTVGLILVFLALTGVSMAFRSEIEPIVGAGLLQVNSRCASRLPLDDLAGRALDMSLHRSAGLYVAAVLLLSTTTALTFTFDWARGAIFAATGTKPMPRRPVVEHSKAPLAPLEAMLASTLRAVPDANDIQIILPRKPGDSVEVQVEDGALHMGAIGGPPVQALLFLGILGVPLLAFTGFRSYLRGRRAVVVTKARTVR
jgi:uncharacterized iron-regulated membrane protein